MAAYLDHAASTPLRPEAREAMLPFLDGLHGNPSGSHRWARDARRALDDARDAVAEALGAHPDEVVLTSGGTESDHLAVAGVTAARPGVPVCSAVEHPAVLRPVEAAGGRTVPVDRSGVLDPDALTAALRDQGPVAVVSVLLANNETGACQDLAAVAESVRREAPGTPLHTDAVAAAPWLDLRERAAVADLVTVSGHKVGGPKGVGALVVRRGTPLEPVLRGGGQERGRRGGTPNVAGAAGLAAALTATAAARDATAGRVEALRARLLDGVRAAVPDVVEVSPAAPERRTPGTLMLCVPGVEREALLFLLDEAGVAASWGSSCSSGAPEPSHVLAAMGVGHELARGALRLSLGWSSTGAEVDEAVRAVAAAVDRLRAGRAVPAGTAAAPVGARTEPGSLG